jgi:DNA polymerase elongation subunit (family B)
MPSIDVEDPRMTETTPFTDPSLDFLYGKDNTDRVVGMTPLFDDEQLHMRLYRRAQDGEIEHIDRKFYPFFFCNERAARKLSKMDREKFFFTSLEGDNEYDHMVATRTWSDFTSILDWLYVQLGYEIPEPEVDEDGNEEINYDYRKVDEIKKPGNLGTLFLMQSGVTFFGDMTLDDIHRMQLDIEVYSSTDSFPDHEREGDEVIIVTISDNRGREWVLTQNRPGVTRQEIKDTSGASKVLVAHSERALLEKTRAAINEIDPDTIEGHNCFPAQTPVLTPDGYSNIEDLEVGDEVLASPNEGELGSRLETVEVEQVHERPYQGQMVQIDADYRTIESTPDHPHFGCHDGEVGWHEASSFDKHDLLALPQRDPDDVEFRNEAYLAGLIQADGHLDHDSARTTFGNTNRDLVEHVAEYVDGAYQIRERKNDENQKPLYRLRTNDPMLRLVAEGYGVSAGNKSGGHHNLDPSLVMNKGDSAVASFLLGVIDGDGHASDKNGDIRIAVRPESTKKALYALAIHLGLKGSINQMGVVIQPTKQSKEIFQFLCEHTKNNKDVQVEGRNDHLPSTVIDLIKPFHKDSDLTYKGSEIPKTTLNYLLNKRSPARKYLLSILIREIDEVISDHRIVSGRKWGVVKTKLQKMMKWEWFLVREINTYQFEGTVYNIGTESRTYVADGVLTHNCYDFDLRYILGRCEKLEISFDIGRDGSEPHTWESSRTFAERDIEYQMTSIGGRSVIDTLFLTLDYDSFAREMASHDLKYTARHFGVAAGSGDEDDRTYVEGDEISDYWDEDPLPLLAYALDDVRETRAVAKILSESPFYLSQILPMGYQDAERKGTATVIEALMTREYLNKRMSVPRPDEGASQSSGGYTDIYMRGVYDRLVYADVSSLYPSIMVEYECNPGEKDPIGLFDSMLGQLLDMRLEIKNEMRDLEAKLDVERSGMKEEEIQQMEDRIALLDAKQSSYKILINSFYGAMGFKFFAWNNIPEADRVAETGQDLLKYMIQEIEKDGGRIVEVDTDGVIFTPLDEEGNNQMGIERSEEAETKYVRSLTDRMPEGIEIDNDGCFERMISLKKKNYALKKWGKPPETAKIKGSSLMSRSNEQFGRDFVEKVLMALMDRDVERIHEIYLNYYEKIVTSDWSVDEFSKTESLKETFEEYQAKVEAFEEHGQGHGHTKFARYEVAMQDEKRGDSEYSVGDNVSYYVAHGRADSVGDRARHVRMYEGDEDTEYYLGRLERFCEKFETFFRPKDFRKVFSPDDGLFGFDASDIEIQNTRARKPLVQSERVTLPGKPGNDSIVGRPEPVNVFDDEYDLYCGRNDDGEVAPTPGDPGWLGNPIERGVECPVCGKHHDHQGSTLRCYEKYLRKRIRDDEEFRNAFLEAIDEETRLGCFCKPDPCHTDVIADVWQDLVETSID